MRIRRRPLSAALPQSWVHEDRLTAALILKRASLSRPSGEWNDDDFDVLADGVIMGRIMLAAAAPVGSPWLWTLAYGQHEDRTPTHGYEPTREAAMEAFAKSWRRES
ncbi:MAG: hypothetical protein WBZ16_13310 [Pseudolabrys sp.]